MQLFATFSMDSKSEWNPAFFYTHSKNNKNFDHIRTFYKLWSQTLTKQLKEIISIFCELNFATITGLGEQQLLTSLYPTVQWKNIAEEERSMYTYRRKKFRMNTLPVESEYDYFLWCSIFMTFLFRVFPDRISCSVHF